MEKWWKKSTNFRQYYYFISCSQTYWKKVRSFRISVLRINPISIFFSDRNLNLDPQPYFSGMYWGAINVFQDVFLVEELGASMTLLGNCSPKDVFQWVRNIFHLQKTILAFKMDNFIFLMHRIFFKSYLHSIFNVRDR